MSTTSRIHFDFDVHGAAHVLGDAIDKFTRALNDFDGDIMSERWKVLMDYDSTSVRSYLHAEGYTMSEIDWLETINDATGHYDSELTLRSYLHSQISIGPPLRQATLGCLV